MVDSLEELTNSVKGEGGSRQPNCLPVSGSYLLESHCTAGHKTGFQGLVFVDDLLT